MISYRITELVAEHEARKKELTECIEALQAELAQERKDYHEAWGLYQAEKAKLDVVNELPDRWREDYSLPEHERHFDVKDCAVELEAALQEQQDDLP